MSHGLVVVQRRGGHLESVHPVSAVMCNEAGEIVRSTDRVAVTTWRSGAKPFQLEASLSMLDPSVVDQLEDEDLAVGAASHSGEPRHVARVESLLARFGASEGDLRCGAHWPVHEDSGRELVRQSREPTPIHNNCSGKHTFMVAALRANGHEHDYRLPEHPVQRVIRASVNARTGGAVVDVVVDGCGVPCFVLPISGMATAFARLAGAVADGDGLLGRIGGAMLRHPELVSGTGRHDLLLVNAATEPIISKVGAEALLCLALPRRRAGIAIKVLSGCNDARAVAVLAVLLRWVPGLVPKDALPEWGLLRNVVGRAVGEREAVWA